MNAFQLLGQLTSILGDLIAQNQQLSAHVAELEKQIAAPKAAKTASA